MTRNIKRQRQGGFTLIELMIVVAIIGILAIIAIPAYMRYIKHSKTSEAKTQLGKIYDDAQTYYSTHGQLPSTADGAAANTATEATQGTQCCAEGGTAEKCDPKSGQWTASGNPHPIWQDLGFAINDATYYLYSYTTKQASGVNAEFTATAIGDLDCDGTKATFFADGKVVDAQTGLKRQSIPAINPDE